MSKFTQEIGVGAGSKVINGSCLCGSIEYAIDSQVADITMCHCSRCRKASGSSSTAIATVFDENFRFTKGAEEIRIFLFEGVERVFCGNCGSPIYGRRSSIPRVLRLRVGTLDGDLDLQVANHVFVGSKAAWDQVAGTEPQHDGRL
jgi:hypothetical protein